MFSNHGRELLEDYALNGAPANGNVWGFMLDFSKILIWRCFVCAVQPKHAPKAVSAWTFKEIHANPYRASLLGILIATVHLCKSTAVPFGLHSISDWRQKKPFSQLVQATETEIALISLTNLLRKRVEHEYGLRNHPSTIISLARWCD